MSRTKLIAGILVAGAIGAGIYLAYAHWMGLQGNSRESLLRGLPANLTTVIYADVAELRQAALLKNLGGSSANRTVDSEYREFVIETGFDYEKDLDRVGIATNGVGLERNYFALVDGRFDRRKIEAYLRKNGRGELEGAREIFHLVSSVRGRSISVAFLSNERIAISNAQDLNAEIEAAQRSTGHEEWMERFARLSGTPIFALMRQDAAIGAILNAQAPGGMRSPQLAQLLNQLLWISIAGKPEGSELRVVAEGECPSEATMRQLSDFLSGITVMAQAGLNDPKLRQKMDPAEREAYMQLLNSIEVSKLDRGSSKSVRATLAVTPEVWAKLAQAAANATPEAEKQVPETKTIPSVNNKKNGGPTKAARRP